MKKFYTLALAAAVALSAAAAERQAFVGCVTLKTAELSNAQLTNKILPTSRLKKAPAKAASMDVTAFDTWECYGLLAADQEGNPQGDMALTLSITESNAATGEVSIILGEMFELKGTFNAANGTLSIPNKQYVGEDKDGKFYFYLKTATDDGKITSGASNASATVGTLEGSTISFPELDIWACGDPDNESAGLYFLTVDNKFSSDPYYSLGMGKFTENLIYPTFMQGAENKTAVDVEVFTDGAGTYIVADPLQALYAAKGWSQYESPELFLDATDPDNIVIPFTETGIANNQVPYLYFSESYLAQDPGYEETYGPMDTKYCIKKKVVGDQVTITFPEDCASIWLYGTENMYYGAVFASTLTFTESENNAGIGSVDVEEANAPAVYYNLQGVRVENPSNGIVIRVQNGKASKVLVK